MLAGLRGRIHQQNLNHARINGLRGRMARGKLSVADHLKIPLKQVSEHNVAAVKPRNGHAHFAIVRSRGLRLNVEPFVRQAKLGASCRVKVPAE